MTLAAPASWSWLARHLAASPGVARCEFVPLEPGLDAESALEGDEACEVLVLRAEPLRLQAALDLLTAARRRRMRHAVVIASARVHVPRHGHPGMVSEESLAPARLRRKLTGPRSSSSAGGVALAWRRVERRCLAAAAEGDEAPLPLTLLRPTPWLGDPADAVSRAFGGGRARLVAGHDPPVQLLAASDLGEAVRRTVERGPEAEPRVYHVAPAGVVPLRRGLELAGRPYRALPHTFRRLGRRLLAPRSAADDLAELQYLRYPWTVSGKAFERATGFAPATSAAALANERDAADGPPPAFDPFGQDPGYVARHPLIRFLHDTYWRVEARGLEHVPAEGPAVLVGVHRGFMPWDGVMTLERVRRATGRQVRFLIHPALVKPPYLANFLTRLGGVIACRENGDRLLADGELLGVYPEGIRGAFTPYRTAYEMKSFGRHDYVRLALRAGAPIVPFVILGSAEIFPILGRLDWRWWQRTMEWPFLPLTPTFPLAPIPLPSKWHMLFLPPVELAEHGPETADDPAAVRAIGERIRGLLGDTLRQLRTRRRHLFWGSIFDRDATPDP